MSGKILFSIGHTFVAIRGAKFLPTAVALDASMRRDGLVEFRVVTCFTDSQPCWGECVSGTWSLTEVAGLLSEFLDEVVNLFDEVFVTNAATVVPIIARKPGRVYGARAT